MLNLLLTIDLSSSIPCHPLLGMLFPEIREHCRRILSIEMYSCILSITAKKTTAKRPLFREDSLGLLHPHRRSSLTNGCSRVILSVKRNAWRGPCVVNVSFWTFPVIEILRQSIEIHISRFVMERAGAHKDRIWLDCYWRRLLG